MPTPAEICTLALFRAGEKQAVDALDDESFEAQASNILYEQARDTVLEEHWWPFARRNADLGLLADSETDTEAVTGWAYTYALPADCIQPRYIETGVKNPGPDQQIPFQLLDSPAEGRVLVTDQPTAELVYTRRVTETGKFTPLFVDALVWKLAYEFTFAIPVKPGVAERMMQGYQLALAKAASSAFKHSTSPAPARPAAIRAR